ncbi:MAG: VOC family protein [Spirillospora sp.]
MKLLRTARATHQLPEADPSHAPHTTGPAHPRPRRPPSSPPPSSSPPSSAAPDLQALARLYRRPLGWTVVGRSCGTIPRGSCDRPTAGLGCRSRQSVSTRRPHSPPLPGSQQIMAHLDIEVDALDAPCERPEAMGAAMVPPSPSSSLRRTFAPSWTPLDTRSACSSQSR